MAAAGGGGEIGGVSHVPNFAFSWNIWKYNCHWGLKLCGMRMQQFLNIDSIISGPNRLPDPDRRRGKFQKM